MKSGHKSSSYLSMKGRVECFLNMGFISITFEVPKLSEMGHTLPVVRGKDGQDIQDNSHSGLNCRGSPLPWVLYGLSH